MRCVVFKSTQDSDLDDEVDDEDQSTSAEDQSDGSWEDEEWGGLDELSKNDGTEAGENDDSVDDDDHEVTETKEGEPSDIQPKVAGQFSYMYNFWAGFHPASQDAISRRD